MSTPSSCSRSIRMPPTLTSRRASPTTLSARCQELNPGYRFALWFGGIHGDKKLGMEQVNKTAENGRYLRPFAKIMLALAARREKKNAFGAKIIA